MKKFILFLFFTTLSFGTANAQENIEDEFIDPGFQIEPTPAPIVSQEPTLQIESNEIKSTTVFPKDESYAQDENDSKSGAVLLEKQENFSGSYKQRRSRHGLLFSVNFEKFYPTDYFSQYRDVYIEDIIDTDKIDLVGGEIGYKFNFKLGSLGLLANYASGSIIGAVGTTTLIERTLTFSRLGAAANLALDNFFEEPWIVPYGQVGLHQFQVEEDVAGATEAKSVTTSIAPNYKFGLMFQLDWIEKLTVLLKWH